MRILCLVATIFAMLTAGLLTGCGGSSTTVPTERIVLMQGGIQITQVVGGVPFGINVISVDRGGIDVNPNSIHFYQNGAEITPQHAEDTTKSGEIYIINTPGAYSVSCSYAIGDTTKQASLEFGVTAAAVKANVSLETVKTADPDLFFTVTTTLTNNSDQAMPWVVLKSQVIGQKITFSTDGATPTVFDIPTGWEIRPGSTWMMKSDPSYKGWVGIDSLSSVNLGSIPAKGCAKAKFKLSPVTSASASVYVLNADGSLGAEIASAMNGYRYLVDGQKYRVIAHIPGKADADIVCSLGNRDNSDFAVNTLAWLSGNEFWCVGPGCNEIMVTVYDKSTMTELAQCWFPVLVPTPDNGAGMAR